MEPVDVQIPPVLNRFLFNNDPPPDCDIPIAQDAAASLAEKIRVLEDEVDGLEARLAQLKASHSQLCAERVKMNGFLSPLRRLPTKLIGGAKHFTNRFIKGSRSDPLADEDSVPGAQEAEKGLSEQIQTLEDEINALEARLAQLVVSHSQLCAARAQIQGILSPLRRFPIELLTKILEACLPPSLVLNRGERIRLSELMSVCRSWRDAALSETRFWACLSLSLPNGGPGGSFDPLLEPARIHAWFNRAGRSPLAISITGPFYFQENIMVQPPLELVELAKNIALIAAEDRHWAGISIHYSTPQYQFQLPSLFEAVRDAPYHPWKKLKFLYLYIGTISPSTSLATSPLGSVSFIDTVPYDRLRVVAPTLQRLWIWVICPVPERLTFSHPTVERLSLVLPLPVASIVPSAVAIARFLPTLRILGIYARLGKAAAPAATPAVPVVHHGVQQLLIRDVTMTTLAYLTLPNVQSLDLGNKVGFTGDVPVPGWAVPAEILDNFFRRSGSPSLASLSFEEFNVEREIWSAVLSVVSRWEGLEHVVLPGTIFDEHFVVLGDDGSLLSTWDNLLLFSSIRHITLPHQPPNFDLRALIRYLQAREEKLWKGYPSRMLGTPTEERNTIHLELLRKAWENTKQAWDQEQDREALDTLREMGVRITVAGAPWN